MGLSLFKRSCGSAPAGIDAPAPNPDPARWRLLSVKQFRNAYVLTVRYLDCTNFEGVKVMVFKGVHNPYVTHLDPHFSETPDSPIARFRPDREGKRLARKLAETL